MIKKQDMVFMNGKMDGFIKEILMTIIEMVTDNYSMEMKLSIEAIGIMESKANK